MGVRAVTPRLPGGASPLRRSCNDAGPVNEYERNTSLSVMLIVSDGDEAVQWYGAALGAEVLWDLGGVAGLSSPARRSSSTRPSRGGAASRARTTSG